MNTSPWITKDGVADADLIAAAPDLLAALKALTRACQSEWAMQKQKYAPLGLQVLAAIDKAEGRS